MNNRRTKSPIITELKESLGLATPLAGAQLAQSSTGFVDTVMMGWLGSQWLAAGALGATAFTVCLIIATAILSAVSPLAATAYGAGNPQAVGRVVRQGLWLSLFLALPVMLLLGNAAPLLHLLGQEASNITLAKLYLQSILWGYLPALGFAVLRSFVSALSEPRPIIVIIIGGTVINIAANYILMLGKLGFPSLGLAGIGWASTLSLWCMFFALTGYILSQPRFAIYGVFRGLHRVENQVLWEILQIGLPIGVLSLVEAGLFTAITLLMGNLGTVTLAAHQIALQSASITFMVPLGISLATTVRVGQFMGQENMKAARLAGYIGISLGGTFMAGTAIVFWLMPEAIISLYLDIHNPVNAAVLAQAKVLLGVAAMFQIVDGIQVCASGALRGLKDTHIPMLIGILAYWGIGFTTGYILGLKLGWGGFGLWCGGALGLTVAAVVLTWRFSRFAKHLTLYSIPAS